MTINSTTRKTNALVGNGNTATYPFAFKVFTDADVVVKKLEAATSIETTLTLGLNNDYIVTLNEDQNSNPGGSITLKSGGNNQNLASGFSIVITSAVEPLQGTDLTNQGGFFPEVINDALDKAVVLHQQQQDEINRSIKFSLTNTIGSLEITENAAARSNKVLGFDNTGEFEVLKELGTYRGDWTAGRDYAVRDLVKDTSTNNIFFCNTAHTSSGAQPLTTNTNSANWDLIVDAAAATTSANNAASSATASANSATAAANSATAAATSETNAASSASTATTKATQADTAKTAAETAKTAAETAKTAAEAALDSFDDRYLGAKASNPTVDNDGNALVEGALYFNALHNIMRVYDLNNTAWLDVNISGTDLTNTNLVAGSINNVNAVGGSIANVNAVASNMSDVNTVAADIAKVVKVADDLNETVSEIETAAADLQETTSEIDTVANSIANVDLVGQNISNINALGQVLAGQTTFTITVQNVGGSNYFFVDGVQAPVLNLIRGYTYIFDQSNNSNNNHPLAFKDANGNSYTSGVTVNGTAGQANANVTFVIPSNAPASLRYYCTVHGNGMGNTITVGDDNIGVVAGSISNVNTVGGAIANVNNVGGSIANVNTVASNLSGVNDFAARYRVGPTNPTSDLDNGDLFYNTNLQKLLVYNSTTSAWEETQTIGNFFINTISQFSGTGGNSATFNGVAYKFTLSNAGQFAQQMLVSINGVVQKPNAGTGQPSEGFALNGSEIVFSSAPPTGADFFIVTIGATVSIGTPSDNTVTSAKIVDGSIVNADVNANAAIAGSKLADDSISLAKLEDGTSTNNGKFLRANNGAAPSFETIDLTNLSASNLTSGTIPDDRFPATLPAVSGANLTNLPASGKTHNHIYNGAMQISQRGNAHTNVGNNATTYTLDRWKLYVQNTSARFQVEKNYDHSLPDGFKNSMRISCTTTDTSLAALDEVVLIQSLEGFDVMAFAKGTSSAKQYTLSFYARSDKTGTYCVTLLGRDNTTSTVSKSYTMTNTWTRHVLTFPADTNSGRKDNDDNGEALRILWWLVAGSGVNNGTLQETWVNSTDTGRATGQVNFADSTNEFYITGVQLEVGDTVSDFAYEDYATSLAKCQRYFQANTCGAQEYEGHGGNISGSTCVTFPTQMRSQPTITYTSTPSYYLTDNQYSGDIFADGSGFVYRVNISGTGTWKRTNTYTADAEL